MIIFTWYLIFVIFSSVCVCSQEITFNFYQSNRCKYSRSKFILISRDETGTLESSYYPLLVPDTSGIRYRVTIQGSLLKTGFEWIYKDNGVGCCWAIGNVTLDEVEVRVYSTASVLYWNCFEGAPAVEGIVSLSDNGGFSGFRSLCVNCSPKPSYTRMDFNSLDLPILIDPSSVISSASTSGIPIIGYLSVTNQSATVTVYSTQSTVTNHFTIVTTTFISMIDSDTLPTSIPNSVRPPSVIPSAIPTQTNFSTPVIPSNQTDSSASINLPKLIITDNATEIMVTIEAVESIISMDNLSYDDITRALVFFDELGKLIPLNETFCSSETCTNEDNSTLMITFTKKIITSITTRIKYPNENSIQITISSLTHIDNATVYIVSYYFSDLSSLLRPSDSEECIVSPVISALLQCTSGCSNDSTVMVDEVIIQFNIKDFIEVVQSRNNSHSLSCVSIQLDSSTPFTGEWNDSGCSLVDMSNDESIVTCNCSHLTHFAILLSPNTEYIPVKHVKILNMIGLVLVPVSLVCMVAVIVVHVMMKSLWNMRTYVHIMLCWSMFMAQLLFITGIDKSDNETLCSGISMVLEYLFLVTFMWMLMEGVVLYVSLSKVFVKNTKYYLVIFTAVSYGIPAVYMAVIIPIGVLIKSGNETQYETQFIYMYQTNETNVTACWLNYESHFIWSFIIPSVMIFLVNIGFFIMTIAILRKHEKKVNQNSVLHWIKVSISLTTVMGITWLGGVLAFIEELLSVAYIMTILISLQGLIIFVLFVVMSKQVRNSYLTLLKKHIPHNLLLNSSKFFSATSKLSSNPKTNKGNNSSPKHTVNGIVLGTFTTDDVLSDDVKPPVDDHPPAVLKFKIRKGKNRHHL